MAADPMGDARRAISRMRTMQAPAVGCVPRIPRWLAIRARFNQPSEEEREGIFEKVIWRRLLMVVVDWALRACLLIFRERSRSLSTKIWGDILMEVCSLSLSAVSLFHSFSTNL